MDLKKYPATKFSSTMRCASEDKSCQVRKMLSKSASERVSQSVCLDASHSVIQAAKHFPPFHTYISQVAYKFLLSYMDFSSPACVLRGSPIPSYVITLIILG
jgi:hypothetical protein